jgi:large subunit ribosomal protein L21
MKYAVIKTGGKQYKVTEGQVIEVELLETDGKSFVFEEVLLVVDGDKIELGMPTVSGMKVFADVVEVVKGDKIEVFKYKSKSRYRKHTGHRQKYTQLKVTGIGLSRPKADAQKSAPKAKAVEPEVVKAPKAAKVAAVKKVAAKKPASPKSGPAAKKAAK